jgi:hypothetical protein
VQRVSYMDDGSAVLDLSEKLEVLLIPSPFDCQPAPR